MLENLMSKERNIKTKSSIISKLYFLNVKNSSKLFYIFIVKFLQFLKFLEFLDMLG